MCVLEECLVMLRKFDSLVLQHLKEELGLHGAAFRCSQVEVSDGLLSIPSSMSASVFLSFVLIARHFYMCWTEI